MWYTMLKATGLKLARGGEKTFQKILLVQYILVSGRNNVDCSEWIHTRVEPCPINGSLRQGLPVCLKQIESIVHGIMPFD